MAANAGETFKPGDACRQSGVYRVIHDPKHFADHDVTVIYGERLPPCNDCGQHVRFVLVHAARHVATHQAFK